MKKLLRLSLVALCAMVSSVAFADAYKTLTFPDDNSENNKTNQYYETWTAIIGSDSWTIENFSNNNWNWEYIRCGRKTVESVASIATAFAIDQPISNIVVTFDKIDKDDKINSISLLVASDADFANVIETVEAPNKEAGDMLFEIKNPTANSYYKLVVDCQSAGSNGIVQISKIQYYKQGDEPEIIDISNTPETAYTVAKAHELIEAGKGLATSVYVKGVITEIRNFDSNYGQLNYYINDVNGTGEDLYVYGGLYLEGEKFTEELVNEVKVGDEVIIYGQLTEYNGTHEFNHSNYIYSLNGVTTGIDNITVEQEFDENAPVYNLQGQRVSKDTKGILIQNGKKFINR